MAVDAVRECCISLLRRDKAKQAKTGQDCLFMSRPSLDPLNSWRKNGTYHTDVVFQESCSSDQTNDVKEKGTVRVCRSRDERKDGLWRHRQNKSWGWEGRRTLWDVYGRERWSWRRLSRETMRPLTSVATSGCSSLLPTQTLQAFRPASSALANTRYVATTTVNNHWVEHSHRGIESQGRFHRHVSWCILIFNLLVEFNHGKFTL